MFGRVVAWVVVAFVISGCATERNGTDFGVLTQKIGPPKAGQARIIVFREKGYGGLADAGWEIQLDGQPMSALKTGTYVYSDRPAGRHKLSAIMALFPAETQYEMTAVAGRTYFFLARPSKRANAINAAAAVGGLSGLVVGTVITSGDSNPGPLEFSPLDEGAARQMMADIPLAETSRVR
jgi:hypothetical protein